MRRHSWIHISAVVLLALMMGWLAGCTQAPITGRKQLILISESQEIALGMQAFHEVLQKEKISKDPELNARVKRVGRRIAKVAGKPEYKWEFVAIDNDEVMNAFCLPGGKVAVYSGLFKVLPNDAALAAVIGHEVAHAVLRHGAERMSHALLARLGQAGLNAAIASKSPAAVRAINAAYGVGVNVGFMLPYSRKEELEADYVGMIFMAKAGYDPTEAVALWERMAKAKKGGSPPELLSTHPADATRINKLKEHLPQALVYYRRSLNQ